MTNFGKKYLIICTYKNDDLIVNDGIFKREHVFEF